jgi:phosphotriesterase-related protein
MGTIETARGPIASDRLGPTLMHEHVFVIDLALEASFDTDFDEEPAVVNAVRRLTELKAAGIDTIVDPTVLGIGRNPPLVQRVAEQVDLNIVLATGVFTTNELPQYFHYRHMLRPPEQGDVLVELFVRDIREGIKGTDGAKAAILKCAIDTPGSRRTSSACCARRPWHTGRRGSRSRPTPTPRAAAASCRSTTASRWSSSCASAAGRTG